MMEGKAKADIKERQRRGEYAEVLAEYADRYKRELHRGDLYMASNFFDEMFWSAAGIVDGEQPDQPVSKKLETIRGLLHNALAEVGANDEFANEFDRHFERCTELVQPTRKKGRRLGERS